MGNDDIDKHGSEDAPGKRFELDEVAEQFINQMGQFFNGLGIPAIGGRVWGLLLISAEPLTAEQLANTLRVSRGSISTNMRLLTENKLVEKLLLTGDRREYYRIPINGLRVAMQQRTREFYDLISIAKQGMAAVPDDSLAYANLEELADYARFSIDYLARLQDTWREHRKQIRKESK